MLLLDGSIQKTLADGAIETDFEGSVYLSSFCTQTYIYIYVLENQISILFI